MTIRIAFLGDTLLGGEGQATLDRLGYAYALDGIRPMLEGADLVVANHEGPLTVVERPAEKSDTGRKRYWYRGLPAAAVALADAGVGVVSLANNHILDFGLDGLEDTIRALDDAGIAHCGAGLTDAEARRPAFVSMNGMRIGFLSLMQRYDIYVRERLYASKHRGGPARLRLSHARADLAAMRASADILVVLVHWGRNYRGITPRQRRLARALKDAGADIVAGHHPHVPQSVEVDDGRVVFYSLGNGPVGSPGRFHSGRPPYGLVATVDVDLSGVAAVHVAPIDVDNASIGFRPRPNHGPEALGLLRTLVAPAEAWAASERGGLSTEIAQPVLEP